MPRQYMTVSEFKETPIGSALSPQVNGLAVGVLDKLLFRASQRVDDCCKKRIGAPLTTTLSAQANAGDKKISVASTLGYDNKAEQAVILDLGNGNQEIVQITSGGVIVNEPAIYPYTGSILLASSLQYGHSSGATVTGCYREVCEAGSASSGDPYAEALQSQAAQLALAHLPIKHSGLTRVVFTKHYPIMSVSAIEHAYSYDITYNLVSTNSIIIEPNAGYYRFMVGSVILPEGFIRTTYSAGYQVVPDDLKQVTALFVADEFSYLANPYGAIETQMGKQRLKFSDGKMTKSYLVQQAEEICSHYKRTI